MLAQSRNSYILQQTKELSWSQDLMEASNLNLTFAEACLINSLEVIFYFRAVRSKSHIRYNRLGQSDFGLTESR